MKNVIVMEAQIHILKIPLERTSRNFAAWDHSEGNGRQGDAKIKFYRGLIRKEGMISMNNTKTTVMEPQVTLTMPMPHMMPKDDRMVGEGVGFERIRRITGYLVGTLDRFNDAKRAEVEDRIKHPLSRRVEL